MRMLPAMTASGPVSRRALLASLGGAALAFAAGCQTPGDELEQGALESVRIQGYSPGMIGDLVKEAFVGQGFELTRDTERELWFERPGTRADAARYGEWFDSAVIIRIQVTLRETGSGGVDVRSDPFLLRSSGSATEDRQPLARRRVSQYGGLLREARTRLETGEFK